MTSFFSMARRGFVARTLAAAGLALLAGPLVAAPVSNSLPPSSSLTYTLKASAKGFKINADSQFDWKRDGDNYTLVNSGKFMFFSFAFESDGVVTPEGLQPTRYQETRNKRVKTVSFDVAAKKLTFSGGESEPLVAGTQDRMSVLVQLATLGRSDPSAFGPSKVQQFRVAGSSRTDNWRFRVVGNDTLDTALGKIKTVHLVRERDHDDGQKVEVWLSADYDWMPVRVLSNETDGDYLDQVIKQYVQR